jgi:branched-chain amino acid transport system substrate-binding protein
VRSFFKQHKEIDMRKMKALAGLTLALSLGIYSQANAQAIKIGAINPYSGPMALYGSEVTRGYELAVDNINAKGGLLGKKVELIRGDATNPQQGIAVVEQLVTRDKVDLFMGTYVSSISATASDAALRYNKLYWETNAVFQALTERGLPNFIRSGPDGDVFAVTSSKVLRDLIAPALKKDIKDIKVWIESEESVYGTGVAQAQKKLLTEMGAQVVGVGKHSYKSIDLNDTVARAKGAAPDVLIQTGYVPDGNLILRTIRDQGWKPSAILYVGTGDTPETLTSVGGDYLEGVVVVGYPRNDINDNYGPGNQDYLAAYRAKYKNDPIAPQGMAAYSGAQILFEAIAMAGSVDPDKVRAAAEKMDKPEGSYPSGFGAKFNSKMQNVRASFTASQWQSGAMVTVYPKSALLPGVTLKTLGRP